MDKCQYPVCEMDPCGPFACDKPAPEKRGKWNFCKEHAAEYDKEKNQEATK
jgi:hypothetical protein